MIVGPWWREIEKRHLPRARLHAVLPLEIENGRPVLPELVRWALTLEEGDLLTVQRSDDSQTFHFKSYLAEIETALELLADPWPAIEPMLRQPQALVGPNGRLLLPEEAAALAEPQGGALVLRAERYTGWLFQIGLERRPPGSPDLWVEKEHTLPILPGCRVILPAEALWPLGLPNGGRLACKTFFAEAEYEPAWRAGALGDRSWVDLAPDGTLALPPSLCELLDDLPVSWKGARLTIHLSGFRITLLVDSGSGRPVR